MPATIAPRDLHARLAQTPDLDVIDVRTPAEYRGVHASGAVLHPLDGLDPAAVLAARRGTGDAPLYILCHGGSRAAQAAKRFAAAGFAHAVVVEGGTQAWREAGLPVVTGKGVISLDRQVRIAAGALVVLGVALGWTVHPWWFGLSAFVGCGLVFAGITDICGMAILFSRLPWNRADGPEACSIEACAPTKH